MKLCLLRLLCAALLLPAAIYSQAPAPGKNTPVIRGQKQEVLLYPATGGSGAPKGKVLFVSGSGGMHRFSVTMARTMASWGYEVYGLDAKHYLKSFTGDTTLRETEIMGDFRELAGWINQGAKDPITLVGYSQGAGLCLLGAVPEENKKQFNGLVCICLPEASVLGWRWIDNIFDLLKKNPHEPEFLSKNFLDKISPTPFVMIQSRQDEWVTLEQSEQMFALAKAPKRTLVIEAQNHSFKNNRDDFFNELQKGLQWINTPSP